LTEDNRSNHETDEYQEGSTMLDDLSNSSTFIEEEPSAQPPVYHRRVRRRKEVKFLGMTAPQRFILSLMVFLMICLLGVLALLFSGSIALPF